MADAAVISLTDDSILISDSGRITIISINEALDELGASVGLMDALPSLRLSPLKCRIVDMIRLCPFHRVE